ncbi:hypothetical protein BG004_007612 [Podila humilis]|nr:hypothetical protein BG004_007612 [Podila humilis]
MGFRWASPLAQCLAVGFICFCCPGMFNALNNIGGGGLSSSVDQNANVAIYTCFAVVGLFAGAIHNILGPKWTMLLGGSTYFLYVGSFIHYKSYGQGALVIAAGGLLGTGAGLLWTAQGAMMMAYPREQDKGKYIGYFWGIFNSGAVLGSVIAYVINKDDVGNDDEEQELGVVTYIAFMAIMGLGALVTLSLASPSSVTHSNGDRILIGRFPTWTGELTSVLKLFLDWRMIVLTPMFMSSNWFYSYQFSTVNGVYFNTRTQAINGILYWFSQIIGSWLFACILDYRQLNRKARSLIGLGIVSICFTATWCGGIFLQKTYSKENPPHRMDYTAGIDYIGPLVLYMCYGLNDAAWQTYCYWLMGALSNDVSVLSRYAGYYKAIQSSGAAIAWRINAVGVPYMTELIICFGLLIVSIPGALFLSLSIKDHSYDEQYFNHHGMDKVDEIEIDQDQQLKLQQEQQQYQQQQQQQYQQHQYGHHDQRNDLPY